MTDQPGSLREAIAEAVTRHYPISGPTTDSVLAAVAQWFRDHETERVEAGATAFDSLVNMGLSAAPGQAFTCTDIATKLLRASDAVVFPAREEES